MGEPHRLRGAHLPKVAPYVAGIDPGALADAGSQVIAVGSFVASTVYRIRATKQLGGPAA